MLRQIVPSKREAQLELRGERAFDLIELLIGEAGEPQGVAIHVRGVVERERAHDEGEEIIALIL